MASTPSLAARLARPVPALALGMCVLSAGLVLLSGYMLLRTDPARDHAAATLPNFMRALARSKPAAAEDLRRGGGPTVQLRGCPCGEASAGAPLPVREPRQTPAHRHARELQV